MITKAIVEDFLNKNNVKVRIPIINNITSSDIKTNNKYLSLATTSCLPNFSYNLKLGDIVYVDFEDNDMNKPVILGIQKNTTSKVDGILSSLNVINDSKIKKIISIGDISEKEFLYLKDLDKNVQRSIDDYSSNLKEIEKNIKYNDEFSKKISTKLYNNAIELNNINESSIKLKEQGGMILKLESDLYNNVKILKNKIGDISNQGSLIDIINNLKENVSKLEDSYENGYTITPYIDYETIEYSSNNNEYNNDKYSSLYECIMYDSTCYNGTGKMDILGVLWHDTGVNNKYIKRYVQPSKIDSNYNYLLNLIGKNVNGNDWNNSYRKVGVNAFIGALNNGDIATVQTLPWDYRPWGCGSGSKGSCNYGWIQFEICEDSMSSSEYFKKIYNEAIKLTVYLCKKFNIDPKGVVKINKLEVPTILCHWDSYLLGLGSGHYDIYDWFPKFGKCKNLSMDDVRNDVYNLISQN